MKSFALAVAIVVLMAVARVLTLGLTPPLAAQSRTAGASDDTPSISFRPFVMAVGERFSAKTTFEAAFGQSFEPFWGGGLQLALRNGLFVEVSASRFKKTGERAFLNAGRVFRSKPGEPTNPENLQNPSSRPSPLRLAEVGSAEWHSPPTSQDKAT